MQIDFRKVPFTEKKFEYILDSIIFSGTFCRISQKLVKVSGNILGKIDIICSRCGDEINLDINENNNYLLCDGIFESQTEKDDELVIEIMNQQIDFESILKSDLESLKLDYHTCSNCKEKYFLEVEI